MPAPISGGSQLAALRPSFVSLLARYQGVIGFVALVALASALEPRTFPQPGNVANIARQVAVDGVIAVGMTFVILTGGIDLSVGSMMALVSSVAATNAKNGMSLPLNVLASLALGGFLGGINGVVISRSRLQPFVVTLATMVMLRGIAQIYTQVAVVTGIGRSLDVFQSDIAGVPFPGILLVVSVVIAYVTLAKTRFGRYVYSIGGNEEASRLSGVPVGRVKVSVYVISGVTVGLAALLFTARTSSGDPNSGVGKELDAIAAVVVGGASLIGGIGSVFGTLVGAFFIGALNNFIDIQRYIQFDQLKPFIGMALKGPIIIAAVLFQTRGRTRR